MEMFVDITEVVFLVFDVICSVSSGSTGGQGTEQMMQHHILEELNPQLHDFQSLRIF
jgi:hypothetical protein